MKRYSIRVPSEYQEVEYLLNSGTQYIDTGLIGTDLYNCEIELTMSNESDITTRYNLNGAYKSGFTTHIGTVATSTTECRVSMNFGFADAVGITGLSNYQFHTIYLSDGIQKVDNVQIGTLSYGPASSLRFLIFARDEESTIKYCSAMKLKAFSVKKNGQYIRNMIPVRRISDSVLGLYDIANDVFYTNQGTGVFTAGVDINNWQTKSPLKYGTATDTLTSFPATVIPDGTNVSADIIGNTIQNGTPTPDSPIIPQGTGDLETVGAKAGQYKIPISSAGQTNNIYLGEVETTRKIKKLVLTGEESYTYQSAYSRFYFTLTDAYYSGTTRTTPCYCSHYQSIYDGRGIYDVPNESIYISTANNLTAFNIKTTDYTSETDFKAYLAQQYAAGTPVTVWYVLATEETGIVNEPLMKIGDYADSVSVANIPTTAGSQTFDVDTTLKPSEVDLTYHGWHRTEPKEIEVNT